MRKLEFLFHKICMKKNISPIITDTTTSIHILKYVCLVIILLNISGKKLIAQQISDKDVVTIAKLSDFLKPEIRKKLETDGSITTSDLATYFRTQFSKRFFYDYKSFQDRLAYYNKTYENQLFHKDRAQDHLDKYPATTQWKLPFAYQNGDPVNAYALRHLARQHKMVDIALLYFNEDRNPKYIRYFEDQLQSLTVALKSENYERIEDGNGVYEVFRSGYRIFNWLWIHNMFLGEKEYGDDDQLRTIATLLQHGQHLYNRNAKFRPGNHQTKGMSALAVLAILFRDFEGANAWYDRAMKRLSEHLDKEINADGFQFERSVHYHMSDINNYFFVYQLAKINAIKVEKAWEQKLRTLFSTLVKIAYPDRSAPVLQDDTEIPWAEKNDISGAMTLGYLLFEDPEYGYFATNKVDERMYWYLSNAQVNGLQNIEQKKPTYGSLSLEDTHYYVMRQGWEPHHQMLIISAGLDANKPDHQHGDMLGIQAMANTKVLLPNYQVRYSLTDFELFKNSMVKNVALVDDELQGKQWTSNKGGSGFGKFKKLPQPSVIAWDSTETFDFFSGSHSGFENIGVTYSRQVLYIKDDFWIVKDNFTSDAKHTYKQVWQGLQLNPTDTAIVGGTRGKNWTVIEKNNQEDFSFLTILFPYKGYNRRIDETKSINKLNDWKINTSKWHIKGNNPSVLSKGQENFLFGVSTVQQNDISIQASEPTDLYIQQLDEAIKIYLLGDRTVTLKMATTANSVEKELKPGDVYVLSTKK